MGSVDFAAKWVQNGNTFLFNSPFDISDCEDGGFLLQAPEEELSGADGAVQEDSYAKPRDITLSGVLTPPIDDVIADPPTWLRSNFDAMAKYFLKGARGQLYAVSSDRLINCRFTGFYYPEKYDGLASAAWRLAFRAVDPYLYDTAPAAAVVLAAGTNALNVGGSATALPIVTVTVTAGTATNWSGTVTLTPSSNPYMTLPTTLTIASTSQGGQDAGVYVIDPTTLPEGTASFGGGATDVTSWISGEFPELPPGASTLTLATDITVGAGGGTAPTVAVQVQWIPRWTTVV